VTDTELSEYEALAAAATPGPWRAERDHLGHWRITWPHSQNSSILRKQKVFSDEDVAFIAAAREAVPALVAEVRRLREALDVASETCDH
jgi:hypothetical protein